jgi:hypothetical protein
LIARPEFFGTKVSVRVLVARAGREPKARLEKTLKGKKPIRVTAVSKGQLGLIANGFIRG